MAKIVLKTLFSKDNKFRSPKNDSKKFIFKNLEKSLKLFENSKNLCTHFKK